ncbi:MAG: plasmid pRiA4b ORF-3 family protein [Leptolyngbyaceae cyanobacterium SM2_3_12]|nr:plasmid pRiA4b ORF-3 family protein [Leptolyngbyaceae cyanobacterium SM2_3_12]
MSFDSPMLYDLRLELLDSDPAIWRRLRVNAQTTLAELHQILGVAMGWGDAADYRFKAPAGQRVGSALWPKTWNASAENLPLRACWLMRGIVCYTPMI